MPMTLKDVEDYERKDLLRVEHIHWAITNEVRNLKNWDNALTLLTNYLAHVIIASEKAVAAATGTTIGHVDNSTAITTSTSPATTSTVVTATTSTTNNTSTNPVTTTESHPSLTSPSAADLAAGGPSKSSSSKFSEFFEDKKTGQFTKQATREDIRLIQFSIAALVRYAPSTAESNVVYMFYLQRQPPIRNDETIDNCLVSLIYQYAQVNNDPELQAKGLDLIKVALERGIGLPSYQSRTTKRNQGRYSGSILASVSHSILVQQGLQISQDGRSLETRRYFGKQLPQHYKQGYSAPRNGSGGFYAGGYRKNEQYQGQGHNQGQVAGRRALEQPQSPPQQQQSQNPIQEKTKSRHPRQDSTSSNRDSKDAQGNSDNPSATTSSNQEYLMDQYEYYSSASRSFSGTDQVKSGGRSGYGGKRTTIAFVRATHNPMLNADHAPPSIAENNQVVKRNNGEENGQTREKIKSEDDVTAALSERVEKLQLNQSSE
ncbi:hypothetical protein FBU30_002314 [Linnemannia zychae]|nr:hypothetical protein FBU30_002314 [Linnemannia zychae]